MVKKLLKRIEFAELAGVSPAAVTKACGGALGGATEGKMIDANHPAAVEYLDKRMAANAPEVATGIDPFYEEAVAIVQERGKVSARQLIRDLKISHGRAKKLAATLRAAQVIPEPEDRPKAVAPPPKRVVKGYAARNITKKQEALAELAGRETTEPVEHPELEKFYGMSIREIVARFGTETAFFDWLKACKTMQDIQEKELKNAERRGELISRGLVQTGIFDTMDGMNTRLLTDGVVTMGSRAHEITQAGGSVIDVQQFIRTQIETILEPAKNKMTRTLKNA